ncbi:MULTISPECIES: AarF/ABC1/UbiB kinase family protein [unclassified Microcystis]|uniref:AarF/ABC1/UbiB kinase family protein n=1 Tax=Microcystis flos-aquae Mf_QC_C_20070823_S10D TaxID=2486236 RepID=A0A552L6N2_9CHRO|nr:MULTISPECIES: AarF/ABC1/UbiB kinase family protein [unclassified Microcystis]MCA2817421.1 AarF/ABC1/UbiB kinase family protein [Microcystis sp. M085S1]MCA2856283.1 AarF/ABC1/UbiB kinase family protein [Microcystis sp. M065S1]TRT75786.1 MAG: AarF/ABC1/UbiB kinase family protein [Microcystis flos-aquae Ma_QC_C_20070823_S18]TRT96347.1 MAG: AarF/ABC1/UbiB kinase family protein [Microcystis flos-aquae Ma_QC_C_20070823_S18D]TRV15890.1 MAG: AarF/ABC1/UbiB kinase family protein [Microcystis flos-aq
MFSLPQTSQRQKEILEIVLGNGWDYMRGVLTLGKTENPQIPTPEVLKKILVELGPFYVKLGQLLSTRPDLLPANYIEALTALQAQVPPVAWTDIEIVITEQLAKPIEQVFKYINPQPIAAGSIGQIHRATLLSGEEVAIKVLRPGIEKIVAQDSALIKVIADLVALTEFGQSYDVVNLAEEFIKAVNAELDFTQEGHYTDQLRYNLTQSRWSEPKQLVIPKIYWHLTNSKLLVLEWLEGKQILEADVSRPPTEQAISQRKSEITRILFRSFFQQIYIDGFFHADPHPGNIFYLDDGRVALIDCGMVGRLDPQTQQILTELLLAIVDLDAKRCSQLTIKLSESVVPITLVQLEVDYERMLRKYYNLNLNQINFSEVVYELLQIARRNRIKLPGNLGLFAKSLANLEGTARKFNPDINILEEVKPLLTNILEQQLIGSTPLQTALRTVLDLKSFSLKYPRQIEVLLDGLTSETLNVNLKIRDLDNLRRSLDNSANRLAFSVIIGSLIIGAAIVTASAQSRQLTIISTVLFATASFIGLWLVIGILRSGRLR